MNSEQVIGMIRQFLPFMAGVATILGWNKNGQFDSLVTAILATIGPLMAVGSLVWSMMSKTNAAIVSTAAKAPGVDTIILQNNSTGAALAPNSVTPSNVVMPGGTK